MGGSVEGRVAVITGAASGIGAATARRLASDGAKLLLSDLEENAGRDLAAELAGQGVDVGFRRTDVRDAAALEALMQTAVDRLGRLDILVNNAGIGAYGKTPDLELSAAAAEVPSSTRRPFPGSSVTTASAPTTPPRPVSSTTRALRRSITPGRTSASMRSVPVPSTHPCSHRYSPCRVHRRSTRSSSPWVA